MNIPKDAKLVFKGVIFDIYQWQQKMFDGSNETFEAVKRLATVQVIPTLDDKILLSFEEQPTKSLCYSFFGGRQEKNEEPPDTAKRELLEETGLVCDDWELFKVYKKDGKIDWPTYFYIARNCRKAAEPQLDPGEKIQVKPVSFEEFMEVSTRDDFWGTKDIVIDLLKFKLDNTNLELFKKQLFQTRLLPYRQKK